MNAESADNEGTRSFLKVLRRFQWGGVVLTTDSTDGHRWGRNQNWKTLDLCPSVESVVKTGLSFDSIMPLHSHPQGIYRHDVSVVKY